MNAIGSETDNFAIVIDSRGYGDVRLMGRAAYLWSPPDGRIAALVTRGDVAPRGESLFHRILSGEGRCAGECAWAGVAWDPETRTLTGVRDPLGEVPLAWFASETRAAMGVNPDHVARSVGVALEPDAVRLATFCRGLTDASSPDFIDGIERVRPGEQMSLGPISVARRYWWDISGESRADATADPVDVLERHLSQAIGRIEGPVTLALSGGLDSAVIASFLAHRPDTTAIHVTSDRFPSVDERDVASEIARAAGLPLRTLIIDDLGIDSPETLSHPQLFPTSPITQLIRAEADGTLVTGIGGDQLFAGSRAARIRALAADARITDWARAVDWSRADLRTSLGGVAESTQWGRLALDVLRQFRHDAPSELERREPWMKSSAWIMGQTHSNPGPLHRLWSWEEVMRQYWYSGYSVHPFAEPALWAWATHLSPADRFRDGENKPILRDLLARRLPALAESVARRPKLQNFNAWAINGFLGSDLPESLDALDELGIVFPKSFENRRAAFLRAIRREPDKWQYAHIIGIWRSLAAERWVRAITAVRS